MLHKFVPRIMDNLAFTYKCIVLGHISETTTIKDVVLIFQDHSAVHL